MPMDLHEKPPKPARGRRPNNVCPHGTTLSRPRDRHLLGPSNQDRHTICCDAMRLHRVLAMGTLSTNQQSAAVGLSGVASRPSSLPKARVGFFLPATSFCRPCADQLPMPWVSSPGFLKQWNSGSASRSGGGSSAQLSGIGDADGSARATSPALCCGMVSQGNALLLSTFRESANPD